MPAGSARGRCLRSQRRHLGGFTYLTLLVVVALLGLALARLGPLWADAEQRDREQELLRIGALYAQALDSYRHAAPGSRGGYPPSLEELLLDTRFVGTRRHLRRLYADPMKPTRPWGLVRDADGGIVGVYSQDERRPLLRLPQAHGIVDLPVADHYAHWVFQPRRRVE